MKLKIYRKVCPRKPTHLHPCGADGKLYLCLGGDPEIFLRCCPRHEIKRWRKYAAEGIAYQRKRNAPDVKFDPKKHVTATEDEEELAEEKIMDERYVHRVPVRLVG